MVVVPRHQEGSAPHPCESCLQQQQLRSMASSLFLTFTPQNCHRYNRAANKSSERRKNTYMCLEKKKERKKFATACMHSAFDSLSP